MNATLNPDFMALGLGLGLGLGLRRVWLGSGWVELLELLALGLGLG